jgi:DNA-binding NarL/FixJ family response regulator
MTDATRVLIVEDHDLLGQSVALALRADGLVVHRAEELDPSAVIAAVEQFGPDIVLLDLQLGESGESGLPLIGPFNERGVSVIVVTGVTDRRRLGECMEAGAFGIVNKTDPFDRLIEAVHNVAAMREIMPPEERDALLAETRRQRAEEAKRLQDFRRLTRREQEILAALMDGKSAEAIAQEWVVSLATVRSQIRSVLTKLGAHSQLAAVALAREARWSPES